MSKWDNWERSGGSSKSSKHRSSKHNRNNKHAEVTKVMSNHEAHAFLKDLRLKYLFSHSSNSSCPYRAKQRADMACADITKVAEDEGLPLNMNKDDLEELQHRLYITSLSVFEHCWTIHAQDLRILALLQQHVDMVRVCDRIWLHNFEMADSNILSAWCQQLDHLLLCKMELGSPNADGTCNADDSQFSLSIGHSLSMLDDDWLQLEIKPLILSHSFAVRFGLNTTSPDDPLRVTIEPCNTNDQVNLPDSVVEDVNEASLIDTPIDVVFHRYIMPEIMDQVFNRSRLITDENFFKKKEATPVVSQPITTACNQRLKDKLARSKGASGEPDPTVSTTSVLEQFLDSDSECIRECVNDVMERINGLEPNDDIPVALSFNMLKSNDEDGASSAAFKLDSLKLACATGVDAVDVDNKPEPPSTTPDQPVSVSDVDVTENDAKHVVTVTSPIVEVAREACESPIVASKKIRHKSDSCSASASGASLTSKEPASPDRRASLDGAGDHQQAKQKGSGLFGKVKSFIRRGSKDKDKHE